MNHRASFDLSKVMIRVAGSKEDLENCFALRNDIFVLEQGFTYETEFDQYEDEATHFVVEHSGDMIATARIRFLSEYAKLERIAIAKPYRGRKLGDLLVNYLRSYAGQKGVGTCKLTGQATLEAFYLRLGFTREGELFEDCGVPHYWFVASQQTGRCASRIVSGTADESVSHE